MFGEVSRDVMDGGARGSATSLNMALVDLPAFGRPAVLVWRKRRWRCLEPDCEAGTWTEVVERIALAGQR